MGDDRGNETRWLSYGELAKARGISKTSATRLAFRRKWPRQVGNDGTARVAVPVSELDGIHDAIRDDSRDVREDITALISELRADKASLRERLDKAEGRIETLTAEVRELGEARAGAEAMARARLEEIERLRGGVLARLQEAWAELAGLVSLVHNERIKLLANGFNTLGVGTILSGIVVPLVGGRFSVFGTAVWLIVGAGLIVAAQAMLGRLKE